MRTTDSWFYYSDLFAVIKNDSLLPSEVAEPASYESAGTYTLEEDRDCTVEDICDFVVEYINSDVLVCNSGLIRDWSPEVETCCDLQGLLSDRLLVIAGVLYCSSALLALY